MKVKDRKVENDDNKRDDMQMTSTLRDKGQGVNKFTGNCSKLYWTRK